MAAVHERRRLEQRQEADRRHRQRSRMPGVWSRRDFFGRMGWAGFGLVSLSTLLAGLRSAFPRVLFKPDTTFKAGYIEDYGIGEVNARFKREFRVWMVRQEEGLYAIYAKCTHLGCTPRWLKAESKFKCPCHGSGFYKSGVNFEGPAPRPLERVRVVLNEEGEIVVDVGVKYRQEAGEWDRPGAFLRA